jgi:transposase-like protein
VGFFLYESPRLGVSSHSLYQWVKRYSAPPAERQKVGGQQAEMKRLNQSGAAPCGALA